MKKKIEKWIDVHWKIVLVLIILIAPIGIYILSLKYSIGTKKELSADSIFSGLTTYVGVIISIYGIYWQVTRTEKKERLEKEHNVYSIFRYIIEKNIKRYTKVNVDNNLNEETIYEFLSKSTLDKKNSKNIFYTLDEKIVTNNWEMIVSVAKGNELLEFNDSLKTYNEYIDDFWRNNSINNLQKEIKKILDNSEDNVYFKLIENEIKLMDELFSSKKESNNLKKYLIESNKLIDELFGYETKLIQENSKFENQVNENNKIENVIERLFFLQKISFKLIGVENIDSNINYWIGDLISDYNTKYLFVQEYTEEIVEYFNNIKLRI